ncbi:hypothetical protein [Demequina sediminicola]|uniref:hypothetical protein n=1 Tax=Demequina sediminicola TaxID=1095026 RepID=UPI0007844D51|nr:hypothetical protein [Demequina sediminicola]
MTSAADLDNRTYFRTLDAAMGDLALPLGAVDKVRHVTRDLAFEHVYISQGRDHIALEALGADKPVAYITDQYIALHPQNGQSEWIEIRAVDKEGQGEGDGADASGDWALDLPMGEGTDVFDLAETLAAEPNPAPASAARAVGATTVSGKKRKKTEEPVVATCASCFTNLPATGVCDYCG